jgi:hypothetical protein
VVGAPSYFANKSRPTAPADLMDHECIRARYSSPKLGELALSPCALLRQPT